jgi:hypothetical protein
MSETASTGAEGTEGSATENTDAGKPAEITTVEQLPEFAQTLIRNLRQENAASRAKSNEKVENAKLETKAEFEAALAASSTEHEATKVQLDAANQRLVKLNAAIEAGVPSDKLLSVASRLNGNTPEEIKADVEEVKKLFGIGEPDPRTPATDPSQGKGSATTSKTGDDFADYITGLWNEQN